jgi:hypothetical protein
MPQPESPIISNDQYGFLSSEILELSNEAKVEAIFYYELVKRPGWKNRRVETVEYVGDCRYNYKVSFDISREELSDHARTACEAMGLTNSAPFTPTCLPLGEFDKRAMLYEFDAHNMKGEAIRLIPRFKSNAIVLSILLGCLLQYQLKQKDYKTGTGESSRRHKETVDCYYPKLYPDKDILLPSKRMMTIFQQFIEENNCYDDFEEFMEDANSAMNSLHDARGTIGMTQDEACAWESMKEIYEFKHLLFLFTNHWLPFLVVNPLASNQDNDLLLKIRYVKVTNQFDLDSSSPIQRVVKFIAALFIGFLFVESVPWPENVLWQKVLGFFIIAVLFYAFLARDFIAGLVFFRGKVVNLTLDRIGSAETEHTTMVAPDGTVLSPIGKFHFLKYRGMSLVIADYVTDPDCSNERYAAEAEAQGSCTTEHVSIRTNKSWNSNDPWEGEEKAAGRRFRRIAYSSKEHHHYSLVTWLRPKVGKRGLGYALAPLITMVALISMNQLLAMMNDVMTINSASLILAMAPLASIALTTAEDEPFIRKAFLRFPRACWKTSIAVAALGFLCFFFLKGIYWKAFLCHSLILLGILAAAALTWYSYHRFIDRWTRSDDAFELTSVPFMEVEREAAEDRLTTRQYQAESMS